MQRTHGLPSKFPPQANTQSLSFLLSLSSIQCSAYKTSQLTPTSSFSFQPHCPPLHQAHHPKHLIMPLDLTDLALKAFLRTLQITWQVPPQITSSYLSSQLTPLGAKTTPSPASQTNITSGSLTSLPWMRRFRASPRQWNGRTDLLF